MRRFTGPHPETVARALNGRRSRRGWVARCPAHDDRRPSLSIGRGRDGRLLLFCHAGCAFPDILRALEALGFDEGAQAFAPSRETALSADDQRRDRAAARRAAQAIWTDAVSGAGTLVERYLASRAIHGAIPETLRFAPDLRHPIGDGAPAMVAKVTDPFGAFLGVQRTWLAPNGAGKAALEPTRAMRGPVRGGAVHLLDGPGPLVVAEGVETALSLVDVDRTARIWAALSTSGMATLTLPAPAAELIVAADGDRPGRSAAETLADRALDLGWRAKIFAAPTGLDWNDVLQRGRRHG